MPASTTNIRRAASTVLVGGLIALASMGASAHDDYGRGGRYEGPVYQSAPQIVVQVPQVYAHPARVRYAHAGAVGGCAAPGWDPRVRYMPGQVVWQAGSLWVASGLSASVWNENSPPEWTPSYWIPAACR